LTKVAAYATLFSNKKYLVGFKENREDAMPNITEHYHNELLMLYQVTIDDIEKTKQWGWTVAYTTVAAQGGVFGLFTAYHTSLPAPLMKLLFILMIVGFAVVGTNHIQHAQSSLEGFRKRITKVRTNLGESFNQSFGEPNPKKRWPLEPIVWLVTLVICLLIVFSCNGTQS
jgi:hypothetical protein